MANTATVPIEEQLKRIGFNYRLWGRYEVRELKHAILSGETIEHAVNGIYEGGFALLVATDQRVLLVDKKPMYLTLEDLRYDMVSELDFNHRLLNSTININTPNKILHFTSYNGTNLRNMFNFVQQRVMEIRHYHMAFQSEQTTPQQAGNLAQQPDYAEAQPAPDALANPRTQVAQTETVATSQSNQPQAIQSSQDFQQAVDAVMQGRAAAVAADDTDEPEAGTVRSHEVGLGGIRRAIPVISAYTRAPLMSHRRGYFGSSLHD